ncbi:MAG: helix-turn-helix domain-containing protein [Phycisphaerae bacterium]|nr:helix-turn-helix domain-containing protein [Phycisphaerae bacterium]
MLSISARTLWALTNSGDIPHVRIHRRVLYRPESLRAWLAAREQRGPGSAARTGVSRCIQIESEQRRNSR